MRIIKGILCLLAGVVLVGLSVGFFIMIFTDNDIDSDLALALFPISFLMVFAGVGGLSCLSYAFEYFTSKKEKNAGNQEDIINDGYWGR